MIIAALKKPLRYIKAYSNELYHSTKIRKRLARRRSSGLGAFDFELFKNQISAFIRAMQTDESGIRYRYSGNCAEPTLYASVYACMTLSLIGVLDNYSNEEKKHWVDCFDSFQDPETGLFYDPVVLNDIYADSDWWGARHLALHMVSGYRDLGARPRFPFFFLNEYYKPGAIHEWLDGFDWNSASIGGGDVDNKIMNVGCLLQFQRDAWNDTSASVALQELKSFLRNKLNPETGMWCEFDVCEPNQRSRMVQFAYHLFPIFFFDNDDGFDVEKIASIVLKTQNEYGGYGVKPNSSACEDIDSVDILLRVYEYCSPELKSRINESIERALDWVLINQMEDGGFVFRLDDSFTYGSQETSSLRNQSGMLPTWFRVLSIAYMTRHLGLHQNFRITNCPGYEFL